MPGMYPTDWQTQVKVFERYGCVFQRQRGDHLIYHYPGAMRPVVIPQYDEVPVTVIQSNMRTVGMTREEYFAILREL